MTPSVSQGTPAKAAQPQRVVVVSHSSFVYWWPVWVVGFLMALLTYFFGHQVAFVPTGTIAERDARVDGYDGRRDVLIAPAGRPLPAAATEVKQPRLFMTISNNLGIIWTLTLCLVAVVTNVHLQARRALILMAVLVAVSLAFALFGWWDALFRLVQVFEIHITGLGYLCISALLFVVWFLIELLHDRQTRLVFTPGELRVRTGLGRRERVYDTHGLVIELNRAAPIRHWLLGFGSADLVVHTSGAEPTRLEWPNVFRPARKVAQIQSMITGHAVVRPQ